MAGQDINAFLNNLYASGVIGGSQNSGGGGGNPTENKGDIKRLMHNVGITVTGGMLPFNLGSALENGGLPQGFERSAATDQMILPGGGMTIRGGPLANLLAAILDLKNMWNGVTAPEISVANISPADLGSFSPPAGGGGMATGGRMDAGAPVV